MAGKCADVDDRAADDDADLLADQSFSQGAQERRRRSSSSGFGPGSRPILSALDTA
jgi:hypothetical protein